MRWPGLNGQEEGPDGRRASGRPGGDDPPRHVPLTLGWAESLVARRLMRHLEPELEHLVHEVLRSNTAQTLLADTMADVLADFIEPAGTQEGGLAERLLISLVAKYLDRPHFRREMARMLSERGAGG